jgi:cytochrome c biogenesis protein CcdA
MGSLLRTIARHAIGVVVGVVTSAVSTPALAPVLAAALPAGDGDPVASLATAIALFVYAAVEKLLKPLWATLGEKET